MENKTINTESSVIGFVNQSVQETKKRANHYGSPF